MKERNRVYAARTRLRKHQQIQELMDKCTALEAETAELRSQVQHLTAENARLRGVCLPGTVPASNSAGTCTSANSTAWPAPQGVANASARAAANTFRFTAAATPVLPRKPPALTPEQLNALRARPRNAPPRAGDCVSAAPAETQNASAQDGPLSLSPAVQHTHSGGSGASVPLGESVHAVEDHDVRSYTGQSRRKRHAHRDSDGILDRPKKLQGGLMLLIMCLVSSRSPLSVDRTCLHANADWGSACCSFQCMRGQRVILSAVTELRFVTDSPSCRHHLWCSHLHADCCQLM
jgi:hypothetical protein